MGHLLFGNGDVQLSIVVLVTLTSTVFAFGLVCLAGDGSIPITHRCPAWSCRQVRWLMLWGGGLVAIGVTLLLAAHPTIASFVAAPLSESAVWALVPLALFLAVGVRSRCAFLIAAALAGVAVATRFDDGIGLLFLLACAAVALWETGQLDTHSWVVTVMAGGMTFGVIALLPTLHNLYYGHTLVVLPATPRIPGNFPLPPSQAIHVLSDSNVRATFIDQLRGVTVFHAAGASSSFVAIVRLIQFVWIASVVALLVHWRQANLTTRMVAALPLTFLVPRLFLQVYNYYPRHVILGYLLMGLAAIFVLTELAASGTSEPSAARQRIPG